jgi:hypothetical protein
LHCSLLFEGAVRISGLNAIAGLFCFVFQIPLALVLPADCLTPQQRALLRTQDKAGDSGKPLAAADLHVRVCPTSPQEIWCMHMTHTLFPLNPPRARARLCVCVPDGGSQGEWDRVWRRAPSPAASFGDSRVTGGWDNRPAARRSSGDRCRTDRGSAAHKHDPGIVDGQRLSAAAGKSPALVPFARWCEAPTACLRNAGCEADAGGAQG